MKIIQVSHAVTADDAASNQMQNMDGVFNRLGYKTEMYANKIDPAFPSKVKHFSELIPQKENLLIYHFSTGTSFINKIMNYPYPIAIYYHNITPAKYYMWNAWGSFLNCLKGRRQLAQLGRKAVFAWAASEYSRQELIDNGFKNTSVLPIILDFERYSIPVDTVLYDKYCDGIFTILFVGRMVPHKCQHDLIEVANQYKRKFGSVRLFLVGGYKKNYFDKLNRMIERYNLKNDVIITGKVSFKELCTYYHLSSVFLSMSEHEGFGVPLIESMIFNKPVFAYAAAAVPETIQDAGVLIKDKDYGIIAETIHNTMLNNEKRLDLTNKMNSRLTQLHEEIIFNILRKDIDGLKTL